MRIFYFLSIFLFCITPFLSFGQSCIPDEIYRDSAVGVYPLPYDSINSPDGGIDGFACIDQPYEFLLTAKVPDVLDFGGVVFQVDRFAVDSITGLPDGLDFACNPDTCVWFPIDSFGCIVIQGTPTSANTPGHYPLVIHGVVSLGFLGDQPVTFPGIIAAGEYSIELRDPLCITGVDELSWANNLIKVAPNPFETFLDVYFEALGGENVEILLTDVTGTLVHRQSYKIPYYQDVVRIEPELINQGIYFLTVKGDNFLTTRKLIK